MHVVVHRSRSWLLCYGKRLQSSLSWLNMLRSLTSECTQVPTCGYCCNEVSWPCNWALNLTQAYIHPTCAPLMVQEVWREQAVGRHGGRHAPQSCQQAGVARLPHDRLHARDRGLEGGVDSAAEALLIDCLPNDHVLDYLRCFFIVCGHWQPASWVRWLILMQDFEALLEKIDQGLRALPATAQVLPPADGSATGLLWPKTLYRGQQGCYSNRHNANNL